MTYSSTYRIGEFELSSRLIVGTGKYKSLEETKACIEASGAQMITVAIRRVNLERRDEPNLLDVIDPKKYTVLPNTAGCYSVQEAVTTARLAREVCNTTLIKLEVIGDPKTLFPDNEGTLEATKILLKEGFTVLPYILDDVVVCKKLEDLGCAAVMPLAAPIGSGLGIRNPHNMRLILQAVSCPVIVDAGVGSASDAAKAMELGSTAVLMNTAIALAKEPVKMAQAMRLAVEAGRLSYEAGRMPKRAYASASSPMEGMMEIE